MGGRSSSGGQTTLERRPDFTKPVISPTILAYGPYPPGNGLISLRITADLGCIDL
jgi:hypothetical protein